MKLGINSKMSLYDSVKCAVKANDVIIPFLDVTLVVKHGCRLSLTSFALYINDLAEEIKVLNCKTEMGDERLTLIYADDFVLIGPSDESLKSMQIISHEWCT